MNFFKKTISGASTISLAIFTFIPESVFSVIEWITPAIIINCGIFASKANEINIVISKLVVLVFVWLICMVGYAVWLRIKWFSVIKGNNFTIRIEYTDLFKKKNCKRVINFDECYTTTVGKRIEDINPASVCGQYLSIPQNACLDMNALISTAGVRKAVSKSKFQKKDKYESGTIVPNGDDLLLAFAKLDERGKGYLTRDEYLECLNKLWKEIEYHYGQKDVCIPLLGAGTTIINGGSGASIPQQELLEMIIMSYILSNHKIKSPNKLIIACKRDKNFSINKIKSIDVT